MNIESVESGLFQLRKMLDEDVGLGLNYPKVSFTLEETVKLYSNNVEKLYGDVYSFKEQLIQGIIESRTKETSRKRKKPVVKEPTGEDPDKKSENKFSKISLKFGKSLDLKSKHKDDDLTRLRKCQIFEKMFAQLSNEPREFNGSMNPQMNIFNFASENIFTSSTLYRFTMDGEERKVFIDKSPKNKVGLRINSWASLEMPISKWITLKEEEETFQDDDEYSNEQTFDYLDDYEQGDYSEKSSNQFENDSGYETLNLFLCSSEDPEDVSVRSTIQPPLGLSKMDDLPVASVETVQPQVTVGGKDQPVSVGETDQPVASVNASQSTENETKTKKKVGPKKSKEDDGKVKRAYNRRPEQFQEKSSKKSKWAIMDLDAPTKADKQNKPTFEEAELDLINDVQDFIHGPDDEGVQDLSLDPDPGAMSANNNHSESQKKIRRKHPEPGEDGDVIGRAADDGNIIDRAADDGNMIGRAADDGNLIGRATDGEVIGRAADNEEEEEEEVDETGINIRIYRERVLNWFQPLPSNLSLDFSFQMKGQPFHEVSRHFLAVLHSANDEEIFISSEPLVMDQMILTKLEKKQSQNQRFFR